jgi:hypothetical protein
MLKVIFDENFNHRILRGLKLRIPDLDYLVAQQSVPEGTDDPTLLEWAAQHNLVLVTHDLKTIPKYAYDRVAAALSMTGVIAVPRDLPIGQTIEELAIVIECSSPNELENRVLYLPI